MSGAIAEFETTAKAPPPPGVGAAGRLLLISGDAPFFVTHFMPLAAAARAEGYEVHLATAFDPRSERKDKEAVAVIEAAGIRFHPLTLKRASVNPLKELALIGELKALIDRVDPAIIHGFGMKPVLYAGAIARFRRLPAVHAVIGLGLPFMGQGLGATLRRQLIVWAFAFVFANPKARVTVEHDADFEIFRRAGALDLSRLVLLGGVGTDMAVFHPPVPEPDRDGPPIVMFASRLIAPKGVRDFAEAARRLKARGVAGRFVFQCEFDLQNPTAIPESEVRAWEAEKIVEWWGHTSDMPGALRRVDVFCLPTFYREGVPKVLIEAAASGLPIVTTNVPGCRDVVADGVNGFLIAPRDIDALEDALFKLLSDAELRRRAGAESRARAVAGFSAEAFNSAVLKLYRAARAP